MSPNTRQITFINAAHTFTHYSLLVLPTAVLAMAAPGGAFGEAYGPILALATGMFVLYGAFSLPQGWIAQRVGRPALDYAVLPRHRPVDGGNSVFAIAGGAGGDLGATGLFGAIYHPSGTAMLVDAAGDPENAVATIDMPVPRKNTVISIGRPTR